jgi:hypothetical protein
MDRGKNVPLNRSIGVINRNIGKFSELIFGEMAVKHIPSDANTKPPKNEKGITRSDIGRSTRPNTMSTGSIIVTFMTLFVAPHIISPPITSSMLSGVATIASKVFWYHILTYELKVHSKKEEFMIDIAINPGAMNTA